MSSRQKGGGEINYCPLSDGNTHTPGGSSPQSSLSPKTEGLFNFETPELKLAKKSFHGTLRQEKSSSKWASPYRDETSGGKSEANECDPEIKTRCGRRRVYYAGSFEGICHAGGEGERTISDFALSRKPAEEV
jgi:hypothetical protein